MRNGGFTGWAAALLLALLSGFLLIRLQERTGELANLRAEMGRLEAAAQATAKSLESLRASVDQIQKQAAPAAAGAAAPPPPESESPSLAKLLSTRGKQPAATGKVPETSEADPSRASFLEMFEGEQGEAMIAEIAEMSAAHLCDPWLDEMNFPPEVEERVRAVFLEYQKSLINSGQDLLGGDFPGLDAFPSDEALRAKLAGVLGPAEMAAYDRYMEELPERMVEEAVEMELMMQARGLSPEGRELYKAALIEERLGMGAAEPGGAFPGGNSDLVADAAVAGYERALERLRGSLSEQDLRILERFIERNRRMHGAVAGVAASAAGEEAE